MNLELHGRERPPDRSRLRRRRWIGATVVATAVVAALLAAQALDISIGTLARRVVLELQRIHPVVFFAGMALLPAVGVPLLPFALAAGPAFAPRLGTPTVLALAIASVSVNTALSYGVARLLKRRAEAIVRWFGYTLPGVEPSASWKACVAVRLAPGLPFWVQSYALGLSGIAWFPYIAVSTVVPSVYLAGAIIGGEAAWHGGVGAGLFGLSLVLFAAIATHLWRKSRRVSRIVTANGL